MACLLLSFLEMGVEGDGEPEIGFWELGDRVRFADFWLGCQLEVHLFLLHTSCEAVSGRGYAGVGPVKISGSLQTSSVPLVV